MVVRSLLALVGLAPALLAGLLLPGTVPTGRLANPWAAWVDGSWVLFDVENSLTGKRTIKQSLVAVEGESFTVRDETAWEGGSSANDQILSLATMGYPHALAGGQRVATERIAIDGREFDCEVWRARYEENGQPADAIAWVSAEVEHPLRIRLKGQATLELEVDRLEDYVTVARRKFPCVRYAGAVTSQGQRTPIAQWRSAEIPGGLLRSEMVRETPKGREVHTLHVREFRGTRVK